MSQYINLVYQYLEKTYVGRVIRDEITRKFWEFYLTVGIGCTGGRHRSVAIANALALELRSAGRDVNVEHRDVEKGR